MIDSPGVLVTLKLLLRLLNNMNTNHLLSRGDKLSAPGAVDLTRID